MKILIVANNCKWESWNDKIVALREWFSRKVTLDFDLMHTSYSVPMTDVYKFDGKSYRGIEPAWYDKFISPMGDGYNIILFVVPLSQWGSKYGARGWRADATHGAIELQVGADEHELYDHPKMEEQSAFFQFARHEILHALYMISKKEDRTHYWWDLGDLEKALDEIEIKEEVMIHGDIWGFIKRFLEIMKTQRLEKWAKAIQDFEGWNVGTRSYRNNNPGNIKYTSYTASLGAIGADKDNFAMFASYEAGFKALKQFLTDAKTDKLISYKGNMTLLDFFSVYAPSSDNNHPQTYASFVARRLGVSVDVKISSL